MRCFCFYYLIAFSAFVSTMITWSTSKTVEREYSYSSNIQVFKIPANLQNLEIEIYSPSNGWDCCERSTNCESGEVISANVTVPLQFRKLYLRTPKWNKNLPCNFKIRI